MPGLVLSQLLAVVLIGFAYGASGAAQPRFTPDEVKEIAGRWIGTVTADIGTMPIALGMREDKEAGLSGTLETGHGTWTVTAATRKGDAWRLTIKAPDGLEGTMSGRVKDGRFTGDWNFAPRAVGTFDLARPAPKR